MSGYKREILASLFLAGITVAAYANVLNCDFINYDDPTYVTENSHVLSGLSPSAIAYA